MYSITVHLACDAGAVVQALVTRVIKSDRFNRTGTEDLNLPMPFPSKNAA
jgi:hypothetical protein